MVHLESQEMVLTIWRFNSDVAGNEEVEIFLCVHSGHLSQVLVVSTGLNPDLSVPIPSGEILN